MSSVFMPAPMRRFPSPRLRRKRAYRQRTGVVDAAGVAAGERHSGGENRPSPSHHRGAEPAPARELPDELLALVDIITPNETEAEKLTGIRVESDEDAAKAANVLHAKGIGTVMITLGSRGVWLSAEGESRRIPGFRVQAIDTIAAGDTFNGALVTALLEGTALPEAIRFAHAAAAIAVTRKGAQPSVPWRTEIDEFLAQQG